MSTALPDFASTALNQRSMHVVLSLIAVASAPLHIGAGPDPGMANTRRSSRQDPHRGSTPHVERTAEGAPGSRLRSIRSLSGSSLYLYTGGVDSYHYAATRPEMAAQLSRSLSQHRSGVDQLKTAPLFGS